MRFLPFSDEWTKVSIGSVSLPLEYGMNAAAKEYDGTHKYIRITDINDETNKYIGQPIVSPDAQLDDKYIVSEDDILFARTGASTGKTYLYNKADGLLYYAGFLIRAHIKPEYNSYFVFSQTLTSKYRNWVKLMSMRSGQPGINSQEFSGFSFYTPTLDEQVKISTFLTLIDERIETQSKIIKKYESLMKGLCNKIFKHDKTTQLSDLVKCKSSTLQENRITTNNNGQYKVFGASGMISTINNYQFDNSAVLVLKDGSKAGKIQYASGKYSVVGTSVVLIPNDARDARYLYFAMLSIDFEKYKVGSGIPHIYFKDYSVEKIYYPDFKQREKIVKTLDAYEAKTNIEKEMLSALQKQKAFLLKSMFI